MALPEWNQTADTHDSFGNKTRLITPHDSTNLDPIAKTVVVTDITAGANISVVPAGSDTAVPFVGVSVGFSPPFKVKRINATGTTVTAVYTVD